MNDPRPRDAAGPPRSGGGVFEPGNGTRENMGLREAAGTHRDSNHGGFVVEHIPILKMGPFLLVTIQVDMYDRLAMALQDDLTERISKSGSRGVLIDISALDVVDSFIGRMIANIASMSRILDAETVVVGMRPAVAITLVELGLALPGVRTALDVEKGMRILSALRGREPGEDEDGAVED